MSRGRGFDILNAVINQGAKQSLLDDYLRNPHLLSAYKLCYTIAYMIGVFSKLDEPTILRNLLRAYEFVDSHEYPKIDLFN